MKKQYQFYSEREWKKERSAGLWLYALAFIMIPVILALMGWIAANGQSD